jgi:hypothetical protein
MGGAIMEGGRIRGTGCGKGLGMGTGGPTPEGNPLLTSICCGGSLGGGGGFALTGLSTVLESICCCNSCEPSPFGIPPPPPGPTPGGGHWYIRSIFDKSMALKSRAVPSIGVMEGCFATRVSRPLRLKAIES